MLLSQPLDTHYDKDDEWAKKRDGYVLVDVSAEAVRRMYPADPWSSWGGARLSHDRTHYILPDGRPLLKSSIRRVFGQMQSEHRFLAAYLNMPNGQVKNFLNACRACTNATNNELIAVVGSKAAEGGGVWHRLFAIWMSFVSPMTIIDFYDYAEREDVWIHRTSRGAVYCQWIPAGVTTEYLKEIGYTIVIDDVWTPETGSGLTGRENLVNVDYSWKGVKDDDGFVPFLHPTETRKFSAPVKNKVYSGCNCLVCRICKDCVEEYDHYVLLREFCSRLGHRAPCLGISFTSDLVELAEKKAHLLTQGQLKVEPEDARFLSALSEELALKLGMNKVFVTLDLPKFQSFQRYHWDVSTDQGVRYPWLEGKIVLFVGVPASVIGVTQIKRIQGLQSPSMCDAVFYSTLDAWKQQYVTNCVYVPIGPQLVLREFPDWQSTLRKVGNFFEYVKPETQVLVPDRKVEPYQKWRDSIYSPISFFPYVETSLLSCPIVHRGEWESGGILFSFYPEEGFLRCVPFLLERWRSSIWVKGNRWCPLSECVHREHFYGQLYAGVPYPWDMTSQEIERYEDKRQFPQRFLRALWKEKKVLTKKFLGAKVPGFSYTYQRLIQNQQEFDLGPENVLLRRAISHPAFSQGMIYETWRKMRNNYHAFSEFQRFIVMSETSVSKNGLSVQWQQELSVLEQELTELFATQSDYQEE
jgi:hypothetical protein